MGRYAAATPEPARTLLRTLAAGASPRALITSGQAPARLVEDVLADAAAHGAVTAIVGASGDDLLAPAVARETRDPPRRARSPRRRSRLPVLDLGPVIYTSTPAPVEILESIEAEALSAAACLSAGRARLRRRCGPRRSELPLELPVLAPVPAEESVAAPRVKPLLSLGSLTPPPVAPRPLPRPPPPPGHRLAGGDPLARWCAARRPSRPPETVHAGASARAEPARESRDSSRPSRSMWGLFAVAGIVFAVGARLSRDRELAHAASPLPEPAPVAEVKAPEPPLPAPTSVADRSRERARARSIPSSRRRGRCARTTRCRRARACSRWSRAPATPSGSTGPWWATAPSSSAPWRPRRTHTRSASGSAARIACASPS